MKILLNNWGFALMFMAVYFLAITIILSVKADAPTLATPAPVDASSPTTMTIAGEVVEGGMAVLDDPCLSTYFGEFGIMVNEVRYPYARIPAIDPRSIIETRITHYGPPGFTANDHTARCISIADCLEMVDYYSALWGIPITGFCAVSSSMPWYSNVRDEVPTLIHVQDHGDYLVLDRKGSGDVQGVDIYLPNQSGFAFSETKMVWRVK